MDMVLGTEMGQQDAQCHLCMRSTSYDVFDSIRFATVVSNVFVFSSDLNVIDFVQMFNKACACSFCMIRIFIKCGQMLDEICPHSV